MTLNAGDSTSVNFPDRSFLKERPFFPPEEYWSGEEEYVE